MKIADASVLVTGGGRGIGRHLVERLLDEARQVSVFEREQSAIEEVQARHPAAKTYLCDVTDPDSISEAWAALEADAIEVDVLINNAGLIRSAPLVNVLAREARIHSPEMWNETLAANLTSVFLVTGRAADSMIRRRKKGVVISISSISARGNAGQSAYSAAKAGVNALTRTWAKELGTLGLRFAAIAPGFLDTGSTRQALSESTLAKLKQQIPLRRLGDVEHVYQTARFIIENDYLNGAVIDVDGGLVL